MSADTRPEPQSLLDTFHTPVVGGRWLLVCAETFETVLLLVTGRAPQESWLILALLFVYNAVSLVIVHCLPVRRIPIPALLATDLLLVALAASTTGGAESPFLGQCYLIIFAGALFYGITGGLGVAVLASLLTAAAAWYAGTDVREHMRDMVPYFLIAGAFTGYLADRTRAWFRAHRESLAQAREGELQAQIQEREMELARSMQTAALPALPEHWPGVDFAVRCQYARQVGGDLYLFIPEDGRFGLVVGDVSGKGLPAALISTSMGHLLPWLHPLQDPCRALRNLNRDLVERLPTDAFASLILAEVDVNAGHVSLYTAGHPPALLWRAREGRVIEAQVHNPVLGIFRAWDCVPEEWALEAGDALVLYSDGLIEVPNQAGEQFDTTGVARVLAETAGGTAEEIADALVKAVDAWGPLTDDLTILVCKRTEGSEVVG